MNIIELKKKKKDELISIIVDFIKKEEGYQLVSFHNCESGDEIFVKLIHELLAENNSKNVETSGFDKVGHSSYSNVSHYKVKRTFTEIVKKLYKRHREIIKESFGEGKAEGTDLFKQLNDGKLTSDDFYRRSNY